MKTAGRARIEVLAALDAAQGALPSALLEAIALRIADLELACIREVRLAYEAGRRAGARENPTIQTTQPTELVK